jgi:uncharacterized protein with PIN domain
VPRFLYDEMLKGLGRWLRAAGYDTVIAAGGLPDRVIAARCAEEDRVLLTHRGSPGVDRRGRYVVIPARMVRGRPARGGVAPVKPVFLRQIVAV